jgi:glutamate 5-kinase
MVSVLVDADLLIILTDVDGLYDCNPSKNSHAKLINYVDKLTDELVCVADGTSSKVGTGGMETKLAAAKITSRRGIHTILAGSKKLENIYDILDGQEIGTFIK